MRQLLVLLLLLVVAQTWAVGARSEDGDQSQAVGARSAGDDQSRSQATPTVSDPPDAGARSAGDDESRSQTAPTGGREDPFDYESSEQISEDLSVSFPVDI